MNNRAIELIIELSFAAVFLTVFITYISNKPTKQN